MRYQNFGTRIVFNFFSRFNKTLFYFGIFFVAGFIFFGINVNSAEAAFSYYKSITLAEAESGTADSTDWPLTIALGYGPQAADADLKTVANGGYVQNSSGYDIRPYSDSALTTALTFELVNYDGVNGKLEMYVKIPTLSASTDTVIYLAFGDSGISTDGSSTATWDSSFKGVWHLPDGTTLGALDSTSNNNDGTITTPTATTGQIDGGASFNGTSDIITAGSATSLDDLGPLTFSAWIRPNGMGEAGGGVVMGKSNGTGDLRFNFAGTNALSLGKDYATTDLKRTTSNSTVTMSAWNYVVVTWDGSATATNILIYVNGAETTYQTTTNGVGAIQSDAALNFNIGNLSGLFHTFDGVIDEVKVSNVARSADWVEAEYLYTLDNAKYSYGSEETPPSNTTVNLASSVKATTLTIDSSQTFGAGSNTLTITGGGTGTSRPLYNNGGTLTVSSATVNYVGTTATEIENTTFNNLGVGTTVDSTATTYTLRGTTTVTTALTIGNAGSTNNDILNTSTDYALSAGSINITAVGTLTANGSAITLTGTGTPFTVSCTFTPGTGTVTYTGSNPVTVTSTTYHHLTLNNSGTSFTQGGAITNDTGGNLTVTAGTLKSGGYNITGTGTGVFSVANSASFEMSGNSDYPASFGTYTYGATSNVRYLQDQAKTVTNASYGNLKIAPSADDITFTLPATLSTVAGNVLIGDGTNAGIITAATNNPAITISGTFSVNDEATFIGVSSAFTAAGTTSIGGGASGVFTAGSGTVSFAGTFTVQDGATFTQGAGDATFSSNATIGGGASGTFTAGSGDINVAANLAISSGATFTKGTGTVIFKKGATQTWTDSTSGQDLGIVQVSDSSGGTWCNISASACNSSWLARRKITLNNSASSENLTNFPVLVQLSASNIDYAKTQGAGEDIRFVDADGTTALSYEIEKWDEAGTSLVWVKVPQIDSGSTTDYIYMYFDNDGATDNQAATSVWDSNFKGVWHLPDGTTLSVADSTSNTNNGTNNSATAATGKIDGGAATDGTSQYVDVVAIAGEFSGTAGTASFWINSTESRSFRDMLHFRDDTGGNNHEVSFYRNSSGSVVRKYLAGGTSSSVSESASNILDGSWHNIVMTWNKNADEMKVYTDGAQVGSTQTGLGTWSGTLNFAVFGKGYFTTPEFAGTFDEMRISSTARSADKNIT